MKYTTRKLFTTTLSVVALLLVLAPAATAAPHNAAQMERAGYDCFAAGPSGWTHCMDLDKLISGHPVVTVNVFSVNGSDFLGTELLLRDDLYQDQPCPQDGGGAWDRLAGTPYMACHHFYTGHH